MLKTCDIAIIGGGAAGLSVAAGAVQLGASVILVESENMGGDCLNYGCVPSKALLAAAKTAETIRHAKQFGINTPEPDVDFEKVMEHVQGVINAIAPNDSVERFEKLGAHIIKAKGVFESPKILRAGETLIQARRFVIATGSSPATPPIRGLNETPYLTNETIFALKSKPEHLIVIGGGPIGCELAQAFLMLGVKVTVLEVFKILPRDEQDLVSILREQFIHQGLTLHEGIKVLSLTKTKDGIEITIEKNGAQEIISGSHVLVSAGRKPNVNNIGLDKAGIVYTPKGIQVDTQLRTTNKKVYAIGDVAGHFQFTHVAGYHAGLVLKNSLFKLRARIDYQAVPWVTYTSPELAHVGLSSEDALKQDPEAKILDWDFKNNDRAQAEHETLGKIKVITNKKGAILGVTILGPNAGELLAPWIIAMQSKQPIRIFTDSIMPYPTLSEINKRVAGEFYTPLLFSKKTRWLIRFLKLLG